MVIPPERVQLALKIARGFTRKLPRSVQREDVEAAAMLGLVKALLKQPAGEGESFEWFVRCRIRGAIIDELRAQDWLPRRRKGTARPWRVVHLEDIRTRDGATLELPAANDWQPEEDIHQKRTLERMWQTPMTERERRIMRACYGGAGRKHLDVADSEHVSEARISQIAARSMARMRDHLRTAERGGKR
jgi:RNA polymerase sigma factor for flagellar operon FliA